jgi:amino acid adenylation domain-containing protein
MPSSAPPSPAVPPPVVWRVVATRAESAPGEEAFVFLGDGEAEADRLTRGALDRRARALAARLARELGADAVGARALLLLPPGLDFVVAFLGCLYAGVVAVPAYPPRPSRRRRPDGPDERLRAVLADSRPRVALVTGRAAEGSGRGAGELPDGLPVVAVDRVPDGEARAWRPPPEDPDAVAFLQYTSGSTAAPRGVEVTHRNLAANQRAIERAFDQSEESVVVGWLPLYHDMGLVGTVLQPIWCGGRAVLMAPAAFLQRPRRWLEAIDRYRATTSGGPDFGYALAARKAGGEAEGLDLASWRVAFDGAEPVRGATLDAFTRAFAPAGFRREAFLPCYGLAEATLFVTGAPVDGEPEVREVSAAALERGRAEPAAEGSATPPVSLVSCGRPGAGLEVAVVDPERRARREVGSVGEIWVAGESVARGYFGRPAETAATFGARVLGEEGEEGRGRWLRTGDLGFLASDGGLFVTGRRKDLIIVRGRNLYPHDLERTAETAHPALRPGGAAAFGVDLEGEERLVLVVEVDRRREDEAAEAAAAARAAVVGAHEVAVAEVVPLPAGELPRTSSGKVRRGECRRRYVAEELESLMVAPEPQPTDAAGGDPARDPVGWLTRAARELGVPVDRGDPEAELPLDSLQAMELRNRIAAGLGVELPVAPFLEGVSVAELARLASAPAAADVMSPDPEDVDLETPGPVTAGQRAFLLLERLGRSGDGAVSPYVVAFAARISVAGRAASPELVARTLERIVARHPVLRTVYPPAGVRVLPPGPGAIDLAVADAPASRNGHDDTLRRGLAAEAERPFDLERGPLVRARIVLPGDPSEAPVLLLAIHHVAVDLWSLEVLLAELASVLAADRGEPDAPPPPPFAAFARWQERRLAERGEALRAFWRDELAGAPRVLELPTDRPRPAVATPAGERLPFDLPRRAVAGARAVAAETGATLFGVLLAAWAALLGRLAGRDELLVGSPAAGRTRPGFEGSVGYFANLLPLRADGLGTATFGELVERLRTRIARALEHQDLPFPAIVETAAPARDRSRHPLVQAGLVLERPHRLRGASRGEAEDPAGFVLGRDGARVTLRSARLEAVGLPSRAVQLDVMLLVAEATSGRSAEATSGRSPEAGDDLATALDLSAGLFDTTTGLRWARSLGVLLEAATRDPARAVADLPLLAPAERAQLLAEQNDTAPESISRWERTVHELIGVRAALAPDAIAVESPGGAVSYGGLVRSSKRLAALLRRAGAGAERAVAVDLDRSPELVITLLAVLEAGSCYVPLDRTYPPARLRAMAAATRPAVVVARRGACVEAPGAAVLDLAEIDLFRLPPSARGGAGEEKPSRHAHPDSLAYVVFTSGSTGEPKAIGAPHRAVARLIDRPRWSPLGPDDALLQLAPVSFDASTFELWGVLAAGARLVVTPPGPVAPDPLGRTLARHEVSALWITTGLFHLAVDAGPERAFGPVRWIGTGGEVTSPEAVSRALSPARDVTVFYGPTESTTFTSWERFRHGEAVPAPVPLGRPIAGTTAWVADARLHPVPTGVPGELVIGGAGLARGYLRRPALTARQFVPDPNPPQTPRSPSHPPHPAGLGADRGQGTPPPGAQRNVGGARLYRSGDLARVGSDGRLRFLGRLDTQVKVRGFRVELGEVEGTLRRCPGVGAAAVVLRESALAAFVAPAEPSDLDSDGGPDPEAIRRRLAAELPAFMVPSTVIVLDALPLGPTGKVDRKMLASRSVEVAPAVSAPRLDEARPRSELERTLAGLWARALDPDSERPDERAREIDPEASFFDLGGHSLGLAKLHGMLTAELGVEIPVADLFDHPSVAAMARHLTRRTAGDEPGNGDAPRANEDAPDDRAARRSSAMRRRRLARATPQLEETE